MPPSQPRALRRNRGSAYGRGGNRRRASKTTVILGGTFPFRWNQSARPEIVSVRKTLTIGRLTMSGSKLPVWLIATAVLLSTGFVLYPQGSANAAKFCAQLRGAKAAG